MKAPFIQIGGTPPTATTTKVLGILEETVLRATELGRNDVAIEAIRALGDIGAVKSVSINNSTFYNK